MTKRSLILLTSGVCAIVIIALFGNTLSHFFSLDYASGRGSVEALVPPPPPAHISTPSFVRGIYVTSCVAATPTRRALIEKLISETSTNTVIIDIKDSTGTISFPVSSTFAGAHGKGCVYRDMGTWIGELHRKGIYVAGRIAVFQDPLYATTHKEEAVQDKKTGNVWKDRKGQSFVDPSALAFRSYIVALAETSYTLGFDEINFDYIRFPSDGDMKEVLYPLSGTRLKTEVITAFWKFLHESLAGRGIITSADIFGIVAAIPNDQDIGQTLEGALTYFDYVAPMMYPSHFYAGVGGIKDPNKDPGGMIAYAVGETMKRVEKAGLLPTKIRPWLQDNDYPVPYTLTMVRAQIDASEKLGVSGWMLWDAGNNYTREALIKKSPGEAAE